MILSLTKLLNSASNRRQVFDSATSCRDSKIIKVLIAMNANVEDRGIKGDCTPLMEAASAGHVDIVSLLIAHGADVNAQSTSGNTPLMYGCAGGHEEVVRVLLESGANVEDHNENGHTPLMEAASAGHVSIAKILLEHGAGINTHSNEFKESALTLACYKGHLNMVRFLLEAGADQEHKTDEMHTALMEASMDGHVEVARLLLDSGAQVNMPTDSFESPLTLAACGGHVDLAMLLIERGANIEEVNDEGYTPLMEAAREGHEEMVALLLSQGANINAQTEETQETALTLACCGGFLEVADFLIKAGADIELGASTPLMEAAQEGHLDLVRYLLETNTNVHAQTQTGDTALTYACENGHTDVSDLLLQFGADLEHESEGGRTPLMKACRAGHLCTVQFLISKRADVNRQTTNNDHTPLSLACAGGHLSVVELLLAQSADPFHKLKDNSTMLIEAAKGGHTSVVQLLLDYPHSIMLNPPQSTATILLTQSQSAQQQIQIPSHQSEQQQSQNQQNIELNQNQIISTKHNNQKSLLRKNRSINNVTDTTLTSAEAQQVRNQPTRNSAFTPSEDTNSVDKSQGNYANLSAPNITLQQSSVAPNVIISNDCRTNIRHEQILHKQQILEELQRVERELQIKGAGHFLFLGSNVNHTTEDSLQVDIVNQNVSLPDRTNIVNTDQNLHTTPSTSDTANCADTTTNNFVNVSEINNVGSTLSFYKGFQANKYYIEGFKEGIKLEKQRMLKEVRCLQETQLPLPLASSMIENFSMTNHFPSNSSVSVITVPAPTVSVTSSVCNSFNIMPNCTSLNSVSSINETCSTISSQPTIASADVSQNTAISDRPKVKAVSKKDNKNVRKTVHGMVMNKLQQQHMALMAGLSSPDLQKFLEKTRPHCVQQVHQLQQQLQMQLDQIQQSSQPSVDQINSDITRLHCDGSCPLFASTHRTKILSNDEEVIKLEDGTQIPMDEAVNIFESINFDDINNDDIEKLETKRIEVFGSKDQFPQQVHQVISTINTRSEPLREFFADPVSSTTSLPTLSPLQLSNDCTQNQIDVSRSLQSNITQPLQKQMLNAFEAGLSIGIQRRISDDNFQAQLLLQSNQLAQSTSPSCSANSVEMLQLKENDHLQPLLCNSNQVQVATQTQPSSISTNILPSEKKSLTSISSNNKGKKTRYLLTQQQASLQQSLIPSSSQIPTNYASQNYQLDPTTISSQFTTSNSNGNYSTNQAPVSFSCMDVDSETDSNHDTALTLACAGGHEELVELLLSRGADIEHRDKKGFTPLILAATAGHQKVVEILLNHGADIEAQSERTKDTPLSLACSGGRYEVVELLLNRGANKEHRNVSDYTPLSLAASGGYVNIIKLLLSHGAEINSRTGSKLGISPLMLAAMNGHTAAVKLLLDMGSDINAQIETNRNTALTLACFQGRHEVVSLLLDRKANVEHRAKTGLTPLMEAASGGYVEVGRVLLNKGADVNATPVPSSRDTALTIAADKGHCRFVELLLSKGTQVEVKNKKGNSPLWLAANGGHLNVVDLLYHAGADIDSQDNRKVSCLMAAFRKGHTKVVKWMVNHVTQFPSDQEMTRYIATVNDKELLERCQECVKIIRSAKETQAAKANKNATILLEELDMEKTREESKKAAAARRRERKKKKKLEKKEEKRKLHEENKKNEVIFRDKNIIENRLCDEESYRDEDSDQEDTAIGAGFSGQSKKLFKDFEDVDKGEVDSGIDANFHASHFDNDKKIREKKREKKKKKSMSSNVDCISSVSKECSAFSFHFASKSILSSTNLSQACYTTAKLQEFDKHPANRDDFEATGNETLISIGGKRNHNTQFDLEKSPPNSLKLINNIHPKQSGKRDEGWKEVVRKGQNDDSTKFMNSPFRFKKVSVPPSAISRVIGRGGSNINAIRTVTGAHIEVEKQNKSLGERVITIKGSSEATKQAHILIIALIKDPDVDILQILPKPKVSTTTVGTAWEKSISSAFAYKLRVVPSKLQLGLVSNISTPTIGKSNYTTTVLTSTSVLPSRSTTNTKSIGTSLPRVSLARLISNTEKKVVLQAGTPSNTRTTMSYTSAIMTSGRQTKIITTNASQTFAAKLSEIYTSPQINSTTPNIMNCNQNPNNILNVYKQNLSTNIPIVLSSVPPTSQIISQPPLISNSLNQCPTISLVSSPMTIQTHYSDDHKISSVPSTTVNDQTTQANSISTVTSTNGTSISSLAVTQPVVLKELHNPIPLSKLSSNRCQSLLNNMPFEYSLFNDTFSKVTQRSMWGCKENEIQKNVNFAAVAGAGISVNNSLSPSNKFIDTCSVEVDISKAPGYRGTTMCSPTLCKSNNIINSCHCTSTVDIIVSTSIQPLNIQSSIKYTSDQSITKPSISLVVTRPLLTQKTVNISTTSLAPCTGPALHESIDSSQNVVDETLNENNTVYHDQNVDSNLLKISTDVQENAQPTVSAHQHVQKYPQTVNPSTAVTTTISISRLNPRAPDFSSTLHSNNNLEESMFNASINQNIFPIISSQQSSNTSVQSGSLTILDTFAYNKYQTSPSTQSIINNPTCNQNHWPFVSTNYSPRNSAVGQVGFTDHLSGATSQTTNTDIVELENNTAQSPTISSSAQVQITSQEISSAQVDDRKIPRPIGTERTWKNYPSTVGPAGDADKINWLLNSEKNANSWSNVSSNMERNQLYCPSTTFNRISSTDTDLQQIMETTYQGSHFRN